MSASVYPIERLPNGDVADTHVGKLFITFNLDDERWYVEGVGIDPEYLDESRTLANFKDRRNAIQYAKRNQHRVIG